MKKPYDGHEIIVLGTNLGGLIAGALLSMKNHRVLLLKERNYQPSFQHRGFRFYPFSNFSERTLRLSFLKKIAERMNLSLEDLQSEAGKQAGRGSKERDKKIPFQVILPDARIDLHSQRAFLEREWKREFPREITQIEKIYGELDSLRQGLAREEKSGRESQAIFPLRKGSLAGRFLPLSSFQREFLGTNVSMLFEGFRHFIRLQLLASGNFDADQIPVSLASYILSGEGEDGASSTLSFEELEEGIMKRFLESGGKVMEFGQVERIDREWRKGFLITLREEHQVFRSQFLILNSPLHRVSDFLGKNEKWIRRWKKVLQPAYVLIPFFMGIREKAIPVGMRDLLISLSDLGAPDGDGNVLFISISRKGDERSAPLGKRALTVEGMISLEKWNQTFLAEYQKGVMRHFEHLFPFALDKIEFTDWSWFNEQVSSQSYPHFIFRATSPFRWRQGIVPTRLSGRLYFTGKENFPYLGIEGEYLAGLMAEQEILRRLT